MSVCEMHSLQTKASMARDAMKDDVVATNAPFIWSGALDAKLTMQLAATAAYAASVTGVATIVDSSVGRWIDGWGGSTRQLDWSWRG